jgi:hypothetical protein
MTAGTVGLIDLRTARERGCLGGQLVERHPKPLGQAGHERADPEVERIGERGGSDEPHERVDVGGGGLCGVGGQQRGRASRLRNRG